MLRQVAGPVGRLLSSPTQIHRHTLLLQHARTTVIVKHMFPTLPTTEREDLPLRKLGDPQVEERALIMVENTISEPQKGIDLLMLKDIAGVGRKGQVVPVRKYIAREKLIPVGAAVYPSHENLEKYKDLIEEFDKAEKWTWSAEKTSACLKTMVLRVPMSPDNPWVLDKKHLRVAFRKMGIELNENCITIPEETITEPQEIEVQVTVNGTITFPVRTLVYHHDKTKDSKSQTFQGQPMPTVFQRSSKSIDDSLAEE